MHTHISTTDGFYARMPLRMVLLQASAAAVLASLSVSDQRGECSIVADALYPGSRVYTALEAAHASAPVVGSLRSALCVFNGKSVADASCDAATCTCTLDRSNSAYGLNSAALYYKDENRVFAAGPAVFIDVQRSASTTDVDALARLKRVSKLKSPPGSGSLGVYYTTYQQEANQIYQNITKAYDVTYTMDDVLRNSSLRFADSIWKLGPSVTGAPFANEDQGIMQHQPALGLYCYYRKRGNETYGYMPDCPEASHVLQTHAGEMTAAGFEYVTPDATNWDQSPYATQYGSDLHQLRPNEVLAEEWANMRLAGKMTPTLGTFDRVNTPSPSDPNNTGVLYQWYLSEFYNNQTLLDLDMIWKTKDGRYKIYTVADEPQVSYSAVRAIQDNGGRGDILVHFRWAARAPTGNYEASGFDAYFSQCVMNDSSSGMPYFSNDVAIIDLNTPCGHYKSGAAPTGPTWTISTSFPMSNTPFGGAKFNGLFLKKQFWDVLADPTPTDYLFMPSWNEFLVGNMPMSGWDFRNPYFYSAGAQPDDPDRYNFFLDGFGSERSRTIEPSLQDGGYYYNLVASCMRVYRLQAHLGIVSNGLGCEVQGEECCTVNDNERFTLVWSLDSPGRNISTSSTSSSPDSLLTNTYTEASAWMGGGWTQTCTPWSEGAPSGAGPGICGNQSVLWQAPDAAVPVPYDTAFSAARGRFMLYANETGINVPGTVPLVRCTVSTGASYTRHFIANSTACASAHGQGVADYVLGYGGASRDSLLLRDVHRCWTPLLPNGQSDGPGSWYHTINHPCAPGDVDEGLLAYAI